MDKQTICAMLGVYRKAVDESLKSAVAGGAVVNERRGIFSCAIVIWLIIFQRLNSDHSLAAAVERLRCGDFDELLKEGSLPARVGRISNCTGGYSRARERVSVEAVLQVADAINDALNRNHRVQKYQGHDVYLIDGSTLRIVHTADNVKAYPQYRNQHGKAHFPLMRIGIATNLMTGVALRPAHAPYNGAAAKDELVLAEELFERIPPGSIVIGDRFFGCCRFADMADRKRHQVIARMKEINAKKFIGTPKTLSGEVTIDWKSNRSRHGKCYSVHGRIIWHIVRRKGFRPFRLILFTTSTLPMKEIVQLYALRWNVELDLRNIKTTLGMDMLHSKSPDMLTKELILGVAAYNLISHLMVGFAKALKLQPRELSFSSVLKRVVAVGGALNQHSPNTDRLLYSLFSQLKGLKLPRRSKQRPPEPRKVWQKGQTNFFTTSRKLEKARLKNKYSKPTRLHVQ